MLSYTNTLHRPPGAKLRELEATYWEESLKTGFFEVFTPYITKMLLMTKKRVDFFAKIDFCSKFGYIYSKIGESPPKCISSFPNRDALFRNPTPTGQ